MAKSEFLFTSESVTEGHPDKMADQISDTILDAILKDDPLARVAVETMVKTGMATPIFYDAGFDGKDFFVPDPVKDLTGSIPR